MTNRALLVALLAVAACGPTSEDAAVTVVPANVMAPSAVSDLTTTFAAALACDAASLTWSIQEAANAGFASPLDGAITQAGRFTAPSCGSAYIGAVLHVQAAGCGRTGVAVIATAEEIVDTVAFAAAVINGTCLAANPQSVVVPYGATIDWYVLVKTTCGTRYVPGPVPVLPVCP